MGQYYCMECGALINEDEGTTTLSGRWVCDKDTCRQLDEDNSSLDITREA